MFVVHVDITLKPQSQQALAKTYFDIFRPAISAQPGFVDVQLLHSREDDNRYWLTIVFDRQSSQQTWVATDLHQEVWPQMEAHYADYPVSFYDTVERSGASSS
ncbi:MAG TPA: antibiotic biosynthesis monooxygenase family protein [Acidobacteriaceae bacterium]|nr:antibiotic biosynthesis monooxygenase family protein [Acidobacteriaceae bacterium]